MVNNIEYKSKKCPCGNATNNKSKICSPCSLGLETKLMVLRRYLYLSTGIIYPKVYLRGYQIVKRLENANK